MNTRRWIEEKRIKYPDFDDRCKDIGFRHRSKPNTIRTITYEAHDIEEGRFEREDKEQFCGEGDELE